jgi:hypothetical protein
MYTNENSIRRLFESMDKIILIDMIDFWLSLDCVYACKSLYWISFSSWKLLYYTNTETRKRYGLSVFFVWSLFCWCNVRKEIEEVFERRIWNFRNEIYRFNLEQGQYLEPIQGKST